MIKTINLYKLFFTSIISTFSLLGHAAIIDYSSYSHDTNTNLEWLDVTATINRSFESVSSELASNTGLGQEGWRYATRSEFSELISNFFSISYTPGENLTYPDSILVEDFIKQFGDTLSIYWSQPNRYWSVDPNGAGATLGLLADTLTSNHDFHYLGHITDEQLIRPGYSLRDSTDEISSSNSFINTFHDYNFGSWLVRNHSTSVPEPSSFNLLLLGLLALAYRKYR